MATTCKSPRKVLRVAHEAARRVLPLYAHRYAPKKFTQHQLFACLILMVHQKKDYRGVCELLTDCPDLRRAVGMDDVPHFTTLQKAAHRLLGAAAARDLLVATMTLLRPRRRVEHAAADSSGLDPHHASRYFVWRTDPRNPRHPRNTGESPKKRVSYRRFGKLMLLVCTASHLILTAVASAGPTPDVHQLRGLMKHTPACANVVRLVADAGFDSAGNHKLLREEHGIVSVIPPQHGRPAKDGKLPVDPYRRLMKTRFNLRAYRRRGQVETIFSMIKRNLGSALRGRSHHSRRRDMLLMAIAHNVAVVPRAC